MTSAGPVHHAGPTQHSSGGACVVEGGPLWGSVFVLEEYVTIFMAKLFVR